MRAAPDAVEVDQTLLTLLLLFEGMSKKVLNIVGILFIVFFDYFCIFILLIKLRNTFLTVDQMLLPRKREVTPLLAC